MLQSFNISKSAFKCCESPVNAYTLVLVFKNISQLQECSLGGGPGFRRGGPTSIRNVPLGLRFLLNFAGLALAGEIYLTLMWQAFPRWPKYKFSPGVPHVALYPLGPPTAATCRPRWLIWMRRLTGDQEVAGSTPAEVGNILSWRLKYFLRSFSPFRWFKKGSCQFLAKECAQYWLTA